MLGYLKLSCSVLWRKNTFWFLQCRNKGKGHCFKYGCRLLEMVVMEVFVRFCCKIQKSNWCIAPVRTSTCSLVLCLFFVSIASLVWDSRVDSFAWTATYIPSNLCSLIKQWTNILEVIWFCLYFTHRRLNTTNSKKIVSLPHNFYLIHVSSRSDWFRSPLAYGRLFQCRALIKILRRWDESFQQRSKYVMISKQHFVAKLGMSTTIQRLRLQRKLSCR